MRLAVGIALALAGLACGDEPYIELQIADERLPFLQPGFDYESLGVIAEKEGCMTTEVEYPAEPLPATLTVIPGACFNGPLSLQAYARQADRRIAESPRLFIAFPTEGALVVTATLTDRPGPPG